MIDDFLVFGGRSSKDFHIHVEKIPTIQIPARRVREEPILGRNGVLHIDEGSFEPFDQPYEIYFHDSWRPTPEVANAIKAWLLSGAVCQRLEDSYDLNHYHIATYKGPATISNLFGEYGRCVITFSCSPEAYLKTGDRVISMITPGSLTNPTANGAKPLIKVYGSGTGELHVSGCTVKFKDPIAEHVMLDSDLMEAYRQDGSGAPENKNSAVDAPDYPILRPGDNPISWTGSISKIEIIPRWWDL